MDLDGGRQFESCGPDRIERKDHRGQACLHVSGAAAIEPLAVSRRLERRISPTLRIARGHDIDMSIQDEGSSMNNPRVAHPYNVPRVLVADGCWRESRMPANQGLINHL